MIADKFKFTYAWVAVWFACLMQITLIVICLFFPNELQQNSISEEQRVMIRSTFYALAIITFPITNLIRHIFLRLLQTVSSVTPLHKRYLVMVIVTQVIMEFIGSLGLIMFYLGDEANTLYIFSLLAFLGFFIHRPKKEEYQSILEYYDD